MTCIFIFHNRFFWFCRKFKLLFSCFVIIILLMFDDLSLNRSEPVIFFIYFVNLWPLNSLCSGCSYLQLFFLFVVTFCLFILLRCRSKCKDSLTNNLPDLSEVVDEVLVLLRLLWEDHDLDATQMSAFQNWWLPHPGFRCLSYILRKKTMGFGELDLLNYMFTCFC